MAALAMNTNSVFHVPPPTSSALLNNEPALQVNDQDLTIMTVKGQYYWHVHASSDEMFYVMDGDLTLQMRPVRKEGEPERAEDDAPHDSVDQGRYLCRAEEHGASVWIEGGSAGHVPTPTGEP